MRWVVGPDDPLGLPAGTGLTWARRRGRAHQRARRGTGVQDRPGGGGRRGRGWERGVETELAAEVGTQRERDGR